MSVGRPGDPDAVDAERLESGGSDGLHDDADAVIRLTRVGDSRTAGGPSTPERHRGNRPHQIQRLSLERERPDRHLARPVRHGQQRSPVRRDVRKVFRRGLGGQLPELARSDVDGPDVGIDGDARESESARSGRETRADRPALSGDHGFGSSRV